MPKRRSVIPALRIFPSRASGVLGWLRNRRRAACCRRTSVLENALRQLFADVRIREVEAGKGRCGGLIVVGLDARALLLRVEKQSRWNYHSNPKVQMSDHAPREVQTFPRARKLVTDVGRLSAGRPVIRGLLEIDVTDARDKIRQHRETTGEGISFTGFLVACAGRAIDANRDVHACRDWLGRLVIFEDVDISTLIEVEHDGRKFPVGHIVRSANQKTVEEIHGEIREVQNRPTRERNVRRLLAIAYVPGFLRRIFLRLVDRVPGLAKNLKGTVVLTSVGMFGGTAGWGLALPTHSLGITVGSIVEKPRYVGGELVPREILHLTMDFDHDIVDGAPAARFAQHFVELVEGAEGLPELP